MTEEILEIDREFDFDEFVRDARLGYAELTQKRKKLAETIEKLTEELRQTTEGLEKLGAALKTMDVEPEGDLERPRSARLSAMVEEILRDSFSNPQLMGLKEADIVFLTLARLPNAKKKSITNALNRMVRSKKLAKSGDVYSPIASEDPALPRVGSNGGDPEDLSP